jgi:hypothetical protein
VEDVAKRDVELAVRSSVAADGKDVSLSSLTVGVPSFADSEATSTEVLAEAESVSRAAAAGIEASVVL